MENLTWNGLCKASISIKVSLLYINVDDAQSKVNAEKEYEEKKTVVIKKKSQNLLIDRLWHPRFRL